MKALLSKIPSIGWVIIIIVLGVGIYFGAHKIGNYIELKREQVFDAKEKGLETERDEYKKQRDAALARASAAEAREQIGAQQADVLKKAIEDRGGKIANIEKQLAAIADKYKSDQAVIDAAANGQISMYQLCIKQCDDSTKIGYPCRVNYCDDKKK